LNGLARGSGKASEKLRQVIWPENWSRRNENPRIRRLKPKRTKQKVAADVRINPGFVSFSACSCQFSPKQPANPPQEVEPCALRIRPSS
jgi:hypothetical protein